MLIFTGFWLECIPLRLTVSMIQNFALHICFNPSQSHFHRELHMTFRDNAQQVQRRWRFMMSWLHTCIVSLLYTDTRYNDKIRFSDNWIIITPPLKSNWESARLCRVFLLCVKNLCTLSYPLTKQRLINDKVKSFFFSRNLAQVFKTNDVVS